jgi:transposase
MNTTDAKVYTEQLGVIPIVAEYLAKINFIENIDAIVEPLQGNHRRLSHGKTCFILVLYLITRPHVMYKVEEWVENTSYLKILFPEIEPEFFNDDRIADTFKALTKASIRNLFTMQSLNVIETFKLSADQVHCDFTSFSVHGGYEGFDDQDNIVITYGHNKDYHSGKKQFMQEVAVTKDGGIPICTQTLDGNTADVTRYIPVWKELKTNMGTSNFMIVGDCKLSSAENLLQIIKGSGYFLAPLTMSSSVKEELKRYVLEKGTIPTPLYEKTNDKVKHVYSGFEVSSILTDPETLEEYKYRRIYVHSSELERLRIKSLQDHIEEACKALSVLKDKANTKYYGSREKIFAKAEKILAKYDVREFIVYSISEHLITNRKKVGKGKPGPNSVYEEITQTAFSFDYSVQNECVIAYSKYCGYFVLATNKPVNQLSMLGALQAYKQEWKVERIWERLKGPLQVLPIRLKLPKHIQAMMFLLLTCAQVFTLIDREAKKTLAANNEKLEGMFPNKIKTASPKTEQIIDKFSNVSLVYMVQSEQVTLFSPVLSDLQLKLLKIIGVRADYYDTECIRKRLESSQASAIIISSILNVLTLNQKVEK